MVRRNTKALAGGDGVLDSSHNPVELQTVAVKQIPQNELNKGSFTLNCPLYTFCVVRGLHMGTALYPSLYGGGRGLWSLSSQTCPHGGGLCRSRGYRTYRPIWEVTATTAFLASGWGFSKNQNHITSITSRWKIVFHLILDIIGKATYATFQKVSKHLQLFKIAFQSWIYGNTYRHLYSLCTHSLLDASNR